MYIDIVPASQKENDMNRVKEKAGAVYSWAWYCFFLNSIATIRIEHSPAMQSATGPAYIIPSMPMPRGRMIMSGRRKIICLVRDRNIPPFGLPIAVKKLELIGCRKFKKVKNRKQWK